MKSWSSAQSVAPQSMAMAARCVSDARLPEVTVVRSRLRRIGQWPIPGTSGLTKGWSSQDRTEPIASSPCKGQIRIPRRLVMRRNASRHLHDQPVEVEPDRASSSHHGAAETVQARAERMGGLDAHLRARVIRYKRLPQDGQAPGDVSGRGRANRHRDALPGWGWVRLRDGASPPRRSRSRRQRAASS